MSQKKMHKDFAKILADYIHFWGNDGLRRFNDWIALMKLDTSKPYGVGAFREALNRSRAAAQVKPYTRWTEEDLTAIGFTPQLARRLLKELYG